MVFAVGTAVIYEGVSGSSWVRPVSAGACVQCTHLKQCSRMSTCIAWLSVALQRLRLATKLLWHCRATEPGGPFWCVTHVCAPMGTSHHGHPRAAGSKPAVVEAYDESTKLYRLNIKRNVKELPRCVLMCSPPLCLVALCAPLQAPSHNMPQRGGGGHRLS